MTAEMARKEDIESSSLAGLVSFREEPGGGVFVREHVKVIPLYNKEIVKGIHSLYEASTMLKRYSNTTLALNVTELLR